MCSENVIHLWCFWSGGLWHMGLSVFDREHIIIYMSCILKLFFSYRILCYFPSRVSFPTVTRIELSVRHCT
jgi:hypothetical protein